MVWACVFHLMGFFSRNKTIKRRSLHIAVFLVVPQGRFLKAKSRQQSFLATENNAQKGIFAKKKGILRRTFFGRRVSSWWIVHKKNQIEMAVKTNAKTFLTVIFSRKKRIESTIGTIFRKRIFCIQSPCCAVREPESKKSCWPSRSPQ